MDCTFQYGIVAFYCYRFEREKCLLLFTRLVEQRNVYFFFFFFFLRYDFLITYIEYTFGIYFTHATHFTNDGTSHVSENTKINQRNSVWPPQNGVGRTNKYQCSRHKLIEKYKTDSILSIEWFGISAVNDALVYCCVSMKSYEVVCVCVSVIITRPSQYTNCRMQTTRDALYPPINFILYKARGKQ